MAKSKNSEYQRGSGCCTCHYCGKRTRETGGDESAYNLCRLCLEQSDDDNALSEGLMTGAEYNKKWDKK